MFDTNTIPPPDKGTDLRPYLDAHPFFKGLPPELIDLILSCAEEIEVPEQTKVFRQDTDADVFYVVLDGLVQVEVPSIVGEPAALQQLGPGKILGWSWLIPPHRWHFDARAQRATRLLKLDGKKVREVCRNDPRLGYPLLERASVLMMERLEAARRQVMENYTGEG